MTTATTSKAPVVFSRTVLSEQVEQVILARILDRVYLPGARLNIDALTREFKLSSSPIREALMRLSALGLVTSSPFAVSPIPSREWFEQLLKYRILVEGWAASEVARKRPAEAIDTMTKNLKLMERGALGRSASDYFAANNKADEAFHDAMLRGAGNVIVAQSINGLHPHMHYARLFADAPQDVTPVIEEHRRILAAIVAGDPEGAADAVKQHLVESWKRYAAWSVEELGK